MSNQKVYMIDGAMYEDTVRERVMLYSFVRHLQEVAHLYNKQAEDMFRCWEIPKRFLAFGDSEDLAAIKHIELLDYEDEEESSEPEDDWLEKFFRGMCGAAGNPNVVVMDLGEILGKMEEQEQSQHDAPAEN